MSAQGAKQDFKISVGTDLSTVVIGGTKVDVASDGKKVTVYTNEGVETKAAAAGAVAAESTNAQVSINKEFVVLNGVTIEQSADGHLVISAPGGMVMTKLAEPELYSVMPVGHSHAGWIYMGPSNTTGAPFYAASEDAGVCNFNKAASLAERQNARQPSDLERDQMLEAKDKGALKGTFNASCLFPGDCYGAATEDSGISDAVHIRCASNGNPAWINKSNVLSWRFVRD